MASNKPHTWQDAVALLARERTLAVTSTKLIKKYGDIATIDRCSVAYGAAKAEYDGLIAGLNVALARKSKPASLSDIETRLAQAVKQRQAFCDEVQKLLPSTVLARGSTINIINIDLSATIAAVIDAFKFLYSGIKNEHESTRKAILIQLEAAKWPEYSAVEFS